MAVGIIAVFLGIRVSGVGWPYYILFGLQAGSILAIAQLQKPNKVHLPALLCFPHKHFAVHLCLRFPSFGHTMSCLVCKLASI